MTLACKYGALGELDLLGFPLDASKTCPEIYKSEAENPKLEFMDPECNIEDSLLSSRAQAQAIKDLFAATCLHQQECEFDISQFMGSNG